jgi:hypothetical protein
MSRLFGSVVIAALSALTVTVSCGGDDSSDDSGGTGGKSASNGGASAHGGKSNSNAGASTTGGSPEAGATSEGGAPAITGGATNHGGATNQGGSSVAEGGTGDSGAPSGGTPSTSGGTAGNVGTGGKAPLTMTVTTPNNTLALDNCGAITPAAFTAVEAGSYDITLKSSTLSKGSVSDDDGNPLDAFDNYVIVNLPLPAGDANEKYRFFMLHGAGDKMTVTLPEAGDIKLFFIDADKDYNSGQAIVTLTPPGSETVVDAITNVIPWSSCLASAPATLAISARPQKVTLVSSTLSSGAQMHDDFVILRVQNEMQVNEHRYTMLNGVGSSYTFTPYKGDYLRAWFISASGGGSGTAKIEVQEL